jgi:NitT/TauT family transport system permease protein
VSAGTLEQAAVTASTPRRRRHGESALIVWLVRIVLVAIVLGLWQIFAGGPKSALPSNVVSRPSSIAIAFWQLASSDQIFSALGTTALSTLYALLISVPIAAVLAAATANRFGRWVLEPIVTVLYAIPKIGLISLYVIILGVSRASDVTLVTSAVVFVFYFAFRQALQELDQRRVIAFRLMGAGTLRIARSLVLGYAVPQFLAACRIAVPLAFSTEIFAELRVPATPGLGVLLTNLIDDFKSPSSVAVMLFILLLGYLLDVVLRTLLRRYTQSVGLSGQ